jgi:uncharacterized protein with PQ loop repeat
MSSEVGFRDSFHGFVDYSFCFPESDIVWNLVGIFIFLGTRISIIPQYYNIISTRSAFGLDSVTLFVIVTGQYILVANIVALQAADFVGVLQYSFDTVIWRLFTFINAAANWLSYLPCSFLAMIFFDRRPRPLRAAEQIAKEDVVNLWLTVAGPIACLLLAVINFAMGPAYGFGASELLLLGRVLGIVAAALWAWQYIPQIITTCRLRSPGNLSLILLAIQAPGSMINAIFMFVGQGNDWTTAISSFLLSLEQFFLLGTCIFFNVKNGRCTCAKKEKEDQAEDLLEEMTHFADQDW